MYIFAITVPDSKYSYPHVLRFSNEANCLLYFHTIVHKGYIRMSREFLLVPTREAIKITTLPPPTPGGRQSPLVYKFRFSGTTPFLCNLSLVNNAINKITNHSKNPKHICNYRILEFSTRVRFPVTFRGKIKVTRQYRVNKSCVFL